MNRITDKRKVYLIVGVVNFVLISYLLVMLFAFLKVFGKDDPVGYRLTITNQIIDEHSSLEDDNSFIYRYESSLGEVTMKFSSNGDSGFIGNYEPHNFIYETDDNSLIIYFTINNKRLCRVTYHNIALSDEDGNNVTYISKHNFETSSKGNYYYLKYSKKDTPKYLYSVSFTYYLSR